MNTSDAEPPANCKVVLDIQIEDGSIVRKVRYLKRLLHPGIVILELIVVDLGP